MSVSGNLRRSLCTVTGDSLAVSLVVTFLALLVTGLALNGCSTTGQAVYDTTSIAQPETVDRAPEVISRNDPQYPRLARQAGLQGDVWISALIDRNGGVADAEIHQSSGAVSLDEAAVMVARDAEYKPAMRNGIPVATWITYVVEFRLGG